MVKIFHRPQSGFTIVEVVVVITVIAILSTISIVSYNKVTNDAKKSSYNSTAQQVKLKLGEYFTDNNRYPMAKSDVSTYLTSVNAGSDVRAEFNKSEYVYNAYNNSTTPLVACTVAANCQHYVITVAKTNWNGTSSESDLTVAP